MEDPAERAKTVAAEAGVRRVHPGHRVALGAGTTAAIAIRALAARFPSEGTIETVASSEASERLARQLGLPVRPLRGDDRFDLMLDGADEVTPELALTKGGGGALLREKLLAERTEDVVILVDPSKLVDRLGRRSRIPLEVVPFARESVVQRIAGLGAKAIVRSGTAGSTFRTDNGNEILDVAWPNGIEDPDATRSALEGITGVVESGLFVGIASRVLVGQDDGRVEERLPPFRPGRSR
ncbi:MAG: ribose-5-phosphate isomerase RpiA [Thermoplasmata archaeon]|nr:ribose-5-phosphate isomerase RpiA [Thermoplasmata archaeon]